MSSPMTRRLTRGVPKYLQIKQQLGERLRLMPANQQLPSIAELRNEFGVALGTMDRAIKELRQEGLVDVRHGIGIYATGRQETMQIGICFAFDVLESDAGMFPRLLLQSLAKQETENPAIICRHYFAAGTGQYWATRYDLLERDVRAHLVDGIIAIGVYFGAINDLAVPTVGLHALPDVTARVELDYCDLVRKGVRALAARGCRRIGYAGGHRHQLPTEGDPMREMELEHDRALREFRREVRKLGLETCDAWVRGKSPAPDELFGVSAFLAEGRVALRAMQDAGMSLPDGVVSTDDYRTQGMCNELASQGLEPGVDLHLASLTNRGSRVLDGLSIVRLEMDPDDVAAALITSTTQLIQRFANPSVITYVKPRVCQP